MTKYFCPYHGCEAIPRYGGMVHVYSGVIFDCAQGCIWTFFGGLDTPIWIEGEHYYKWGEQGGVDYERWIRFWKEGLEEDGEGR